MTFDEMFPDAPEYFEVRDADVIKCHVSAECWQCKTPTPWVELNFEAHLCSPECVDKAWHEFFEALEATKGQIRTIFGEAGEIADPRTKDKWS